MRGGVRRGAVLRHGGAGPLDMCADPRIDLYAKAQRACLRGAGLEKAVFLEAAGRLDRACGAVRRTGPVIRALRFNLSLWTVLEADLARPDNLLPVQLKADLFSLALYVDRETARYLRSGGVGRIAALSRLNRIMAGG